ARQMDAAFWVQAYGDRQALLDDVDDPGARRFVEINYGPWDRLAGNEPFLPGVGPKPPGANFYPPDLTREELEAAARDADDAGAALASLYTMVRRGDDGALRTIPYHRFFRTYVAAAAAELRAAAELVPNEAFARYLRLRADALETDDYRASDLAWLDVRDNDLDVVIGPIETYEDQLVGAKAAFEGYVLRKDRSWSERLSRYAALLPSLQRGLPVPPAYKRETPGTDSDLNAYDVLFYAGDCNAGSKTIAINLPNDEEVQLAKGTRRLQLKNAMRAKFDRILVPIAAALIAEDQREHVDFDAFFANTMFHEVAHGLGVKNVIRGRGAGTVRAALAEHASTLEEGKADVLGLFMVTKLLEGGEDTGAALMDHYVTFVASIFRSIRFGASSAHGRANLIRFNYFLDRGAFQRDAETGTYRIDPEKMGQAVDALSEKILRLQGDGDYEGAGAFIGEQAIAGDTLTADLARLADLGIPVDIVFEQGPGVLALPEVPAAPVSDAEPAPGTGEPG
ncbi:MAG TPA: hypothetical protein RMF84_10040, partial [Polyangiaceae bacterium LLY-WYZ-14_1]|nr:hypothetical protein [Polyangiaceae bacterium LLY-WYZ-14_1]